MKFIHTADLHLGQILYRNYDRGDEHEFFFRQLEEHCKEEKPDALLLCGDVFDIHQPSARVRQVLSETVARLRRAVPEMSVVIIAGNHDSGSRIQSDNAMWRLSDAHLIGLPPTANLIEEKGWEDNFIIRLAQGWIIAVPFMSGDRPEIFQQLLTRVEELNTEGLPVVMMAHLAISGADTEGHDFDIGTLRLTDITVMGNYYDYLALGHIHKPQTLGHPEDCMKEVVTYQSPIARYSGSALHISSDETYPHTISLVEIEKHGGDMKIKQLRVNQLRHFLTLPQNKEPYQTTEEALEGIKELAKKIGADERIDRGRYFRLRMVKDAVLSPDFNQSVYDIAETVAGELRYNPRIIREGDEEATGEIEKETIKITELQDMSTDPIRFIERTFNDYADLGVELEELRTIFSEVKEFLEEDSES